MVAVHQRRMCFLYIQDRVCNASESCDSSLLKLCYNDHRLQKLGIFFVNTILVAALCTCHIHSINWTSAYLKQILIMWNSQILHWQIVLIWFCCTWVMHVSWMYFCMAYIGSYAVSGDIHVYIHIYYTHA